jgi:hypothetical protein
MGRSVRVLGVAALVVAPMVFGSVAPAAARSTSVRVAATSAHPSVVPNTTIKGTGANAKFTPGKLATTWSGPAGTSKCNATNNDFTITNATGATRTVGTDTGIVLGTIPAKSVRGFCFFGGPPGRMKVTIGMSGSLHVLKLSVS